MLWYSFNLMSNYLFGCFDHLNDVIVCELCCRRIDCLFWVYQNGFFVLFLCRLNYMSSSVLWVKSVEVTGINVIEIKMDFLDSIGVMKSIESFVH